MKQNNSIEAGFKLAKETTQRYAKTFYFASRFLPREKKEAAYAVYAICRISDEAVDSQRTTHSDNLVKTRENIELAYSDTSLSNNLLLAFRQTVNKFKIPKEYFWELIDGMGMDLKINRYETFDDLYNYCYKAAGVVGLIMLKIFGVNDNRAEKSALELGIAMQLTNIIRDIKEDFSRGRVYLPQKELSQFGVTQDDLSGGKVDENFKRLVKFQINRARQFYANSEKGIKLINNAFSRFVIYAMKEIYAAILDSIEHNGYDVFSKRAYVSGPSKAAITLRILLRGKYL
jgi:phytoene synthase